MIRKNSIRWAALVAATVFGAAGCQSTVTDSISQQPPAAPERIAAKPKPQTPIDALPTVYFELDRWQLGEDARQALQASARQIQAQSDQAVVTIEGHCDDRGSDEYNMALGERRAGAVKRYLVDLGVPASRFETVTYGETRPAVRGEGERAWRMNRRSELRIGFRQAAR